MIRRPPRSTLSSSSAASDVYKRQAGDPRLVAGPLASPAGHRLVDGGCRAGAHDIAASPRCTGGLSRHRLPLRRDDRHSGCGRGDLPGRGHHHHPGIDRGRAGRRARSPAARTRPGPLLRAAQRRAAGAGIGAVRRLGVGHPPGRGGDPARRPGGGLGCQAGQGEGEPAGSLDLSLIHISEPTRLLSTSYAVFCLKKKKINKKTKQTKYKKKQKKKTTTKKTNQT